MAVLFSDGFESGDFSAWTGQSSSGTTLSVETVPHHGTYGFQVAGLGAISERGYVYKTITPLSEAYIRTYTKISAEPAGTLWDAGLALDDNHKVIYDAVNDYWGVRDNIGGWTNHWGSVAKTLSTTWICVEFHLIVSDTVGVYQIWVDGTLVLDIQNHNTGTTNITTAVIGQLYLDQNESPDRTAWYDCVVVADAYIGVEAGGLSIPVAMHHYGHHINKIIRG